LYSHLYQSRGVQNAGTTSGEKEIKQWKESDDETLTLPNWK